jgi:hypothetical protein
VLFSTIGVGAEEIVEQLNDDSRITLEVIGQGLQQASA